MSTVVSKNVQIGADGTASNNFTAYQPSTPDGTLRIGNGNSGSVTDAIVLNSSGVVSFTNNPTLSGGTANGVTYLNGSKVLTSGSALTFDGATFLHTGQSSFATSTGNVMIGSGSTDAKLRVVDAAGNGLRIGFLSGSSNLNLYDATSHIFRNAGGTGEYATLNSTGLGIGTSSPSNKFVVSASGAQGIEINPNVSGTSEILAYNRSGSAWNPLKIITSNFKVNISGGGDALTLDSSGNLGLGVTPSAWGVGKATEVGYLGNALWGVSTTQCSVTQNTYYDTGYKYASSNPASYFRQFNGTHAWFVAPSGTAGNAISFTQAMTLDASGNLGVGTSSPAGKFEVYGLTGSPGNGFIVGYGANGDNYYTAGSSGIHVFRNAGTERARIDSSGRLLVAKTSALGNSNIQVSTTPGGNSGITVASTAVGTNYAMLFYTSDGVDHGYISYTTSGTSYNTTSDYRLKEAVTPMTGALAKVAALKPCTYKWKADGSDGEGFIAHELAEVVPQCVTGEKDAVETYLDENGVEQTKPRYQGIDTSFLVATLTAAIQEQQAIIESLTARVSALEGN